MIILSKLRRLKFLWQTQTARDGKKLTWIKQIGKDLEKVEFKTLVKNNNDGYDEYFISTKNNVKCRH